MSITLTLSANDDVFEIELTSVSKTSWKIRLNHQPDQEVTGQVYIKTGSTQETQGVLSFKQKQHRFYAAQTTPLYWQVWIAGHVYQIAQVVKTPQRKNGSSVSQNTKPVVTAPMPGNLLQLLVNMGDHVQQDQPVCVLESMKMELTLTAPIEGNVIACFKQPGDKVQAQEVLIQIEPV
jgi:biotin carboxyl carrier protein